MIIHKIGFCFDSYMPSAIVKSPHHRAQQLFLSEWDLLWYTVKKYQHRESFHDIDDQGMIIDERIKAGRRDKQRTEILVSNIGGNNFAASLRVCPQAQKNTQRHIYL